MSGKKIIGCCPLDCQDTCSWVAHVENGRVVRVTGATEHPITKGVLCTKVNDYQTRTYASDRLLHPLLRTGPKGSGQFQQISWDEALDKIADHFKGIIREHGPEALMPLYYVGSMGTVQRQALRRLFHGLGASDLHGDVCGASMNSLLEEGHPVGFDPQEIADSKLIILWGVNMLTTCHHHWQFVKEARQRHGAHVVAIDPRRNRTTEKCDEHIAIRPGTDAVFASGLAYVMLTEDLADLDYMQSSASDFEEYRAEVLKWPPERVAAICGIEQETIKRLARAFALAKPAVIRAGVAPQQTIDGDSYARALSALACLGGHWRSQGGGLFAFESPASDEFAAARPDLKPGSPRSLDMSRLCDILTDQDMAPAVKGLMVWCMNPAVTEINAGRVKDGLGREDLFTVVLEHFMTDTARYADIILPATTQLEHFDLVITWGHQYIAANNPAIKPLGEAKSHGEVMRLLAPRLGLLGPAYEDTDEEIAATALPSGVSFETLKSTGWCLSSPPRPDPATTRYKLRFAEKIRVPEVEPGFRLLTPKSHYFLNSSFANMHRHRKAEGTPMLEMNTADATERGLTNGELVLIHNNHASINAHLKITDTTGVGVVAVAGKWWGNPKDTATEVNLLSPARWSSNGQPAYNDTFVEVTSVARNGPSDPASVRDMVAN
ncbi:MAG: molybdopterin-dependent oxidoreductase [Alphaproteobacteria bacterium]